MKGQNPNKKNSKKIAIACKYQKNVVLLQSFPPLYIYARKLRTG